VTASTRLWRLDRGRHARSFENQTPSQVIKDTLSRHNLRADCEPFGPVIPHWTSQYRTDWGLVQATARRYGRDIYCFREQGIR
jgi:phage protein D